MIRRPAGRLLYSGNMGSISADLIDAQVSAHNSFLDVNSLVSPVRHVIPGYTHVTFTAELAPNYQWDQSTVKPAEKKPWDITALLALARRHPDEYAELVEAEAVMKALGG